MRPFRLSHRHVAPVTVAVLVGALTAVISPTLSASASPGDRIAPVSATSAATYQQTFGRADGDVAATYTLAGANVTQNATSTGGMNSRGSSVVFSPTSVLTSTGAQVQANLPSACAGGSGTATDCGTAGTITVAFDRPVTNPTLHVSGLGGQQTTGTTQSPQYANFAAYFNLTGSTSSTAASNSASFGSLLGTPTNLQLSAGRLQTTGLRPSTSCDNNGTTGATSTAGCGSVLISGANLTSVTLTVGVRNSGAATDPTASQTTLSDAFLVDVSIPDVTPPLTNFACAANSVYAVHDTDWNIHKVDVNTGAETFIGHVNAASGSKLDGLGITDGGGAAYLINRNVTPGGPTTIYRLDPTTNTSTAYAGPTLSQTTSGGGIVGGAVDPANGIYYFGLVGGDGLEIYGFNTNTNTPVAGRIAHVPGIVGPGADFTFDKLGRLTVVASSGDSSPTANPLLMTRTPMPSAGSDVTLTLNTTSYLQPTASVFGGVAFDLPQGYLYGTSNTSGQSTLRQINPASGNSIASNTITYLGQTTTQVSDLSSCEAGNSIQVQADVVSRANTGDQFTVQVTGGGLGTVQSGTTSGSSTGVQTDAAATAGPAPAIAGANLTIKEIAEPGADLADYLVTWRCVNLNNPGITIVSGTGSTGTITFPTPVNAAGMPLGCYFRNEKMDPSISITKTRDHAGYHVGETVTYTITVTNTGNVPLTGVAVADPTNVSCVKTIGTLAVGGSNTYTCTATAPVPTNSNTANVSATDPRGNTLTASSTVAVPVIRPSLSLSRTTSPTTVSVSGQVVTHTYTVTNTGDSTITGISIADTATAPGGVPSPISCNAGSLASGDSTTCTGSYAVTQADIENGSIKNRATARGVDQLGSDVSSNAAQATVTATRSAGLALLATATPTTVATAGSTVSYSFLVQNTGNVSVSGVSIGNVFANSAVVPPQATCPKTTLAPSESTTCTASYVVTQDDLDEGSIDDTATASGSTSVGNVTSNPSATSVTASTSPSVSLTRSVSPLTVSAAQQTVTYTYTVTNTGGQTLHGLTVDETLTSPATPNPAPVCLTTDLAPAASTTCSASYTVKQADVDHGSVAASAVAHASTRQGTSVSSAAATDTRVIAAAPGLSVTTTPAPTSISSVGQHVTYTFGVRNTGNVTVHGVEVADSANFLVGATAAPVCQDTSLAPNATTSCTATYTVSQADLDNSSGKIDNSVVATGLDPNEGAVESPRKTGSVTVTATKLLTVTNSAQPNSVTTVGQDVVFTFTVRNDGNQTLSGLGVVAPAPDGSALGVSCTATTLAPGASKDCTTTWTTTQQDLDNGTVTVTGSATATAPGGVAVGPTPSTASVPVTTTGVLRLTASASPTVVTAVGQTVTFTFTVKNQSNRTATGIVIDATAPDGSPLTDSCAATSLAPDASTICTADYVVTQADITAGTIEVQATLSADSGTTPISASLAAPATVVVKKPSIAASLTGQRVDVDGDHTASVGDRIVWSLLVTNTSDIALHDLTVVDDAGRTARCAATDLDAGKSTTCTLAPTTLTQRMIDSGTVTNAATVTADGGGQEASSRSTASVAFASGSSDGDVPVDSGGSVGKASGGGSDNTLPDSSTTLPLGSGGNVAGTPADTGVEHLPLLVWSGLLLVLAGLVTFAAGYRRRLTLDS